LWYSIERSVINHGHKVTKMRKALLILGTFALMIICGAGAALTALSCLMSLGLKHYDNYEHYGQTPAVFLVPLAAIIGFATPGILVWWFRNNRWRISVRALLVIMTLVASILGLVVYTLR
jgi:hypothetical protein